MHEGTVHRHIYIHAHTLFNTCCIEMWTSGYKYNVDQTGKYCYNVHISYGRWSHTNTSNRSYGMWTSTTAAEAQPIHVDQSLWNMTSYCQLWNVDQQLWNADLQAYSYRMWTHIHGMWTSGYGMWTSNYEM